MPQRDAAGSLRGMIGVFIEYPWLAAVIGVWLLWLGRWRGRGAPVAAGVVWLLYAVYETGMKQRWWCSGECNIRVDLLLAYPILLVLTVVAVVSLRRIALARNTVDSMRLGIRRKEP